MQRNFWEVCSVPKAVPCRRTGVDEMKLGPSRLPIALKQEGGVISRISCSSSTPNLTDEPANLPDLWEVLFHAVDNHSCDIVEPTPSMGFALNGSVSVAMVYGSALARSIAFVHYSPPHMKIIYGRATRCRSGDVSALANASGTKL